MAIHLLAFTANGARLCAGLLEKLEEGGTGFAPLKYCIPPLQPLEGSLAEWTQARFATGEALVFIGSAGIAVRAIAPLVAHKGSDPAVVCMDEKGQFVIPLLSGHIGGANALAQRLAALSGGAPVLTTATDVNNIFAPDAWAAQNGYVIEDTSQIKHISAALLDGEAVGLTSEFPVDTPLPSGLVRTEDTACGIEISLHPRLPYPHTLHLLPCCLTVGVGCRKNVEPQVLDQEVCRLLAEHSLPLAAVGAIATIAFKAEEPAILALCAKYRTPLRTFTAEELAQAEGAFVPSEFVRSVTGVDNVCERAAVRAGGALLVPKTTGNAVALAVAIADWRVAF